MKDSTKTLLGFAAGIAVGASAYALSKTDKGQKVIKSVSKKVDDISKDVKGLIEKGKVAAEDLSKDITKKFNGAVSKVKETEITS